MYQEMVNGCHKRHGSKRTQRLDHASLQPKLVSSIAKRWPWILPRNRQRRKFLFLSKGYNAHGGKNAHKGAEGKLDCNAFDREHAF
ncbi:hypothetical protein CEXT_645711 [Caerostris extrusa]|uniref:Uncharacterized protein n=1 Tax=Caerostris extrusa TaxID=172846 RepID=A0AAV4YBT8_CAEEX|nr:hypothetical protein CEXT_645711 [Caerostris extrusa]